VVIAACYYFKIDPIAMASGALSGVADWFTKLSDTAKALYVSLAASFGGAIGWIKTKLNFNGFKKQTEQANTQVEQKIGELQGISAQKDAAIENLTVQKQSAEAEVQKLQSEYSNYKTVLEGKDKQIERLQSQIDGLSKLDTSKLAEDVSTKLTENQRVS
jgi:uncharacterized protein HemX